MGLFGKSKKKKELKEAQAALQHLEKRKRSKAMTSTAVDPTRAITELQPWQVNQEAARPGFTNHTHKDIWGNEIKEPDLTNPTRNRWERPLDTVRSFQESIDRGYRRSYYGGADGESQPPGSSHGQQQFWQHGRKDYSNEHVNRIGNSTTPISSTSSSGEVPGYGALDGRTVMGDYTMSGIRNRNHSNGSGPYADTGYGESINHGSRGNSSGNLENDMAWSPGGGAVPYTASPLQQQQVPPAAAPAPKNVIKLSNSPGTPPASNVAVGGGKAEGKRKSWMSRRFSKN